MYCSKTLTYEVDLDLVCCLDSKVEPKRERIWFRNRKEGSEWKKMNRKNSSEDERWEHKKNYSSSDTETSR